MKVINTGRTFRITDDSLKTYDLLPAGVYTVRFSKMSGFYLEAHEPLEVKEDKIYGAHQVKVDKVLKSFGEFNRSLGVILSGDKGIGKSMFARLLSIEANKQSMPLIIVEEAIPGIASFIEEIQQEVVVLFDEFDKTFAGTGDNDPQATLLSLFDGVSGGKKLYVITCNQLNKLNDYLINRPGRFHYHFRFEYPCAEEIREYLRDKLKEEYYGEIDNVISFSRKVSLNYDCLRAISFELNLGISFKEAIKDLNIINVNNERYDIIVNFENHSPIVIKGKYLDLFGDDTDIVNYDLYCEEFSYLMSVNLRPSDAQYDSTKMAMIIPKEKFTLDYDNDYSDELVEKAKQLVPDHIVIKRQIGKSLHYAV